MYTSHKFPCFHGSCHSNEGYILDFCKVLHTASIFRVMSPRESVGKVKQSKENCITLSIQTSSSFKMANTTRSVTQHHILKAFHHSNTTQISQ